LSQLYFQHLQDRMVGHSKSVFCYVCWLSLQIESDYSEYKFAGYVVNWSKRGLKVKLF